MRQANSRVDRVCLRLNEQVKTALLTCVRVVLWEKKHKKLDTQRNKTEQKHFKII